MRTWMSWKLWRPRLPGQLTVTVHSENDDPDSQRDEACRHGPSQLRFGFRVIYGGGSCGGTYLALVLASARLAVDPCWHAAEVLLAQNLG
jgi:hypothetical protein